MTHPNNLVLRSMQLSVAGGMEHLEMIGDALRRIPGVSRVTAQDGASLVVEYDPSLTAPDQFLNVARQAGLDANPSV